jgi:RNA polymerase sigma factor (sigma-70 family)
MDGPSEADRYLLEEIRRGSGEAWSQLVDRYQGRLIAYARHRAPQGIEPEDLVQDTFVLFLRSAANFRGDASLETFLFVILRRRLSDAYRVRHIGACGLPNAGDSKNSFQSLPAPDPTASWYVRRDEERDAARSALAVAVRSLVRKMQENQDFQDLQIVELLFYAQWKNQRIASELDVDAKQIALLKHRWLKQLQERVVQSHEHRLDHTSMLWDTPEILDSLLTEIWEDERPSCPKRSTIGGFVLGTLDEAWQHYIDCHINRMECSFCRANLEDLQVQSRQDPAQLHRRILQSTVGFFRKP